MIITVTYCHCYCHCHSHSQSPVLVSGVNYTHQSVLQYSKLLNVATTAAEVGSHVRGCLHCPHHTCVIERNKNKIVLTRRFRQSWLPSFSLLQRAGNGAFSPIMVIWIGSPWPPLLRGLDSLVHSNGDKHLQQFHSSKSYGCNDSRII